MDWLLQSIREEQPKRWDDARQRCGVAFEFETDAVKLDPVRRDETTRGLQSLLYKKYFTQHFADWTPTPTPTPLTTARRNANRSRPRKGSSSLTKRRKKYRVVKRGEANASPYCIIQIYRVVYYGSRSILNQTLAHTVIEQKEACWFIKRRKISVSGH